MDKKNTILLTVIAVATLLVAVVGATFAYFSITENNSGSTKVSATTEKVGTVTVTGGDSDLNLVLTAQDMAKSGSDKSYYAIGSGTENGGSLTGGKWSEKAQDLKISTITLSGAEEDDTVKCDVSVKVDLSGTMVGHLQTGDVSITISSDDYEGFGSASKIDLQNEQFQYSGSNDSATASATFTGSEQVELKNGSNTKEIKARVWLVNKDSTSQNYLADKTLTVAFTTSVADCKTTSQGEAA